MSIEVGGIAGKGAEIINIPDKNGKTTIDKIKDLSAAQKALLGVVLTGPAAVWHMMLLKNNRMKQKKK